MQKPKRIDGKVRSQLRRAVSYAVEQLESRRMLSASADMRVLRLMGPAIVNPDVNLTGAVPQSIAPQVAGGLAGHVIYTSGGHGYVWRTGGSWGVMRSYLNNMMEDMGNQDQLEPYAKYLLAAGATVVSMRPLGHQTSEVIVDNSDVYSAANGGFDTPLGTWSGSTGTPYWSNNNGNDAVHYMSFATNTSAESAVARFTPKIVTAGFYPVYAWWTPGTNRADDTTYRINYSGGSAEVKVAQDKVGNGWVYLGNYYFAAGVSQAAGSVEVSNKSAFSSKVVIADAVRFGNGMGTWTQYGAHAASGKSREDECALYWCYESRGWTASATRVSDDVVDNGSTSDDETKNFSACDRYAAYMNNSAVGAVTDRLWISFHSNAASGTARGTVGLIEATNPTANQAWLANAVGTTVEAEMTALDSVHEFAWGQRSNTATGGYSEISTSVIGTEFDATICEVAFHDNATDAALLKNPQIRSDVGRATYHTAIKYFDQFDAAFTNITYLPEAPDNLRVTTSAANTNLTVSWAAGLSSSGTTGPYGNAATGYRVWTSTNGYGFDLAGTTASTSFTLTGNLSAITYVRVTATNPGGESMPSVIAAGKPQAARRAPILIVNNFGRMDDDGDQIESHYFGTAARARARYNNSYDYVVQAAESIETYNINLGVEYCTDTAIAGGQIVLGNYQTVIWMSGEQSTVEETFSSTTQPLVTSYLSGGGKMFVSGSEIAWDLFGQASETAADQTFLTGTLHANYVSDDAATYTTAAGIAGTALAGVSALSFDNGTHGTYDVDYPDELSANGAGASVAMNYSTGNGHGAVIQYISGNTKLLYMGFPFESIYTASQRNSLMSAVLNYLETSSTLAPGTPDLVAASDTGTSSTDNLTKKNNSAGNTLQFSVTGTVSGLTVQIFAGATLIGSQLASGTTTTVTTDGVTVLSDGAYAITAKQTDGVTSTAASSPLSITVDASGPAAPPAITISANATSITPDWDASSGADFYRVFRSLSFGSGYAQLTTVNSPTTVHTDSTAVPGTTYFYVVAAEDNAGNASGNSSVVSAVVPLAPGNVDLSAGSDSGSSNTDNNTNFDNSAGKSLDFTVNGTIAGAMVRLYVNGVLSSSLTAPGTSTTLQPGSILADGTYTITATQQEPSRPESAATAGLSVTVDTTAPAAPTLPDLSTASDSGPDTGDNYTSATLPTFSTTGESNITATLSIDGSPAGSISSASTLYTITAGSALGDGVHEVRTYMTDKAGNVSATSSPLSITVDTQSPAQPVAPDLDPASDTGSSSSDDLTTTTLPTLNGSAEPNSSVTIYAGAVAKGTGSAAGDGTYSITLTGALSQGVNLMTVKSMDQAGNVSNASTALSIMLDTVAPTASVPDLAAGSDSGISNTDNITNITTPTFNGTSETGATVAFLVDAAQVATDTDGDGVYGFTTAALGSGNHSFQVVATDVAGNVTTTTGLTVTIDTTGPVAPGTPDLTSASDSGSSTTDNNTSMTTPTFTVLGEAGGTASLEIDGISVATATSAGSTYTITVPTVADGVHTVKARITDKAGNVGTLSAGTLTLTIDTVAPAMPAAPNLDTAFDSGSSSSDDVTNISLLKFTGSAESGSAVTVYDDGVLRGSGTATGGNYSITLTSAIQEGANAITVKATDLAGNASAVSAGLPVTLDTAAPSAAVDPGYAQPAGGAGTYDFVINYGDTGSGVDVSSLDNNDLLVTGPNGYSSAATLVGTSGNDATYRIPAPGGAWDPGDNGTFTVSQVAAEVEDLAGNARGAGTIGTLSLGAPFAWIDVGVLHVDYAGSSGITISLAVNGANLDVTRSAQTLSFAMASFSTVAVSGTVAGETLSTSGTYAQPVSFTGNGGGDTLAVAAGTFTFASDAGATAADLHVTIAGGASAVFNSSQHIGALDVAGSATLAAGNDKVIVTKSLTVAGRLDLKDNALIWDYTSPTELGTWNGSAYTGAIGMAATGRAGGDWSGNGIVTSQTLAIAPSFRTTIGVAEAGEVLNYGVGSTASFGGETVDTTAILFKYTYAGDLDLNGRVDGDDYFIIDQNYPQSGSLFGYHNGDVDFNGRFNADDYFFMDANYAGQGPAM